MSPRFSPRQDHESYCGAKSTACELCGKEVPKKRLVNHRAAEHGINPCAPAPGFARVPSGEQPAQGPAGQAPRPALVRTQSEEDIEQAMAASLRDYAQDDADFEVEWGGESGGGGLAQDAASGSEY